jgi:HEAT repeat protein
MRARSGRVTALVLALTLAPVCARARADSVDDLIRTLATTDSYKIKVQVCLGLGKKGDKRAVPILSGALHDENATVRLVAAQALGKIGDSSALDALNTASRDYDSGVANAARMAIEAIKKSGKSGTQASGGGGKFYISVGPLSNKSKGGGPEAVKMFREYLVSELRRTPGVSLDGGMQKGQVGYYIDGNIVQMSTSVNEVSCDLKVLVATYPSKSIIMWTDGGASVQGGVGGSAMRDCLEAAVKSVSENIATFLKAQR